ncbi:MAG: MarC family protein [Candidatus Cybelea sp.]
MLPEEVQALVPVRISFGEVFTFLFVMVGPLRVLGSFATLTAGLSDNARRQLALRTAGLATVSLLIAAFLGNQIIAKWHVSPGVLLIAGGVVLFLVALSLVLQSPAPSRKLSPADDTVTDPKLAGRAALSAIVTPYGIALLICLIALQLQTVIAIVGALLIVIALDLLAMLYAKPLLRWIGAPLQMLGAVLSILQVALGLQLIADGLYFLFKKPL